MGMSKERRQTRAVFRAGMAAALAAGWLVAMAPQGAAAQGLSLTAYKQAVAESLSEDEGMAAFYRARGFEPLWTADDVPRHAGGLSVACLGAGTPDPVP